jgi:hypothetical protein
MQALERHEIRFRGTATKFEGQYDQGEVAWLDGRPAHFWVLS